MITVNQLSLDNVFKVSNNVKIFDSNKLAANNMLSLSSKMNAIIAGGNHIICTFQRCHTFIILIQAVLSTLSNQEFTGSFCFPSASFLSLPPPPEHIFKSEECVMYHGTRNRKHA